MSRDLFDAVAPHMLPVLLVFSRLGGLFLMAPVLGGQSIPVRVRVLLALALTLVVYPMVSQTTPLPLEPDMVSLIGIMATELLIGLSIGALATLPLLAVQAGGHFIGQQMALGIASVFDPATNADSGLIGQTLTFLLMTSFLAMGGLEIMLGGVIRSLELVPLGAVTLDVIPLDLFVGLMSASFSVAVRVSAPVVCIIFVETLATGMIMKTVPQLNILSFGFPVKILAGLGMLAASLVFINAAIGGIVERSLVDIVDWAESLAMVR